VAYAPFVRAYVHISVEGDLMKKKWGMVVACALGAQFAIAAPAMAQGGIECDGVLTGPQPYNITVPSGADCRLEDATVGGNVVVRSDGGLIVEGSTINGNVRSSGARYWGFTDSNDGNVTVINGNVELVETVANPLAGGADSMSRYNFACEATDFNGNVSIRGSLSTADFLFGSPDGGANMMRAPDLNMQVGECSEPPMMGDNREGNFVRDTYEANGNTGEVRQRDNTIEKGHFNNFGNTAAASPPDPTPNDIDILRNSVARTLTCQGNTPVPHQEGNSETGNPGPNDQCPPGA